MLRTSPILKIGLPMFQLQGFVSPELSHPTFPLAGPDRPDVASFSSELVPGTARLPPRGLLQTPPFYQLLTFRCQVKQEPSLPPSSPPPGVCFQGSLDCGGEVSSPCPQQGPAQTYPDITTYLLSPELDSLLLASPQESNLNRHRVG